MDKIKVEKEAMCKRKKLKKKNTQRDKENREKGKKQKIKEGASSKSRNNPRLEKRKGGNEKERTFQKKEKFRRKTMFEKYKLDKIFDRKKTNYYLRFQNLREQWVSC